MFIYQAVEKAIKEGKYITRENCFWGGIVKIKPTNTCDCCIAVALDKKNPPRRGWQPKAEDLMADDWYVCD